MPAALPPAQPAVTPAPSAAGSVTPASARSPAPHEAPPGEEATLEGFEVERVLEERVGALAIDKVPYVAALGDERVFIHGKQGWYSQPLPPDARRAADGEREIFFGRDYRPRIIAYRRSEAGERGFYWRSLPEGVRLGPEELGALSRPPARASGAARGQAPGTTRFVAVLGTADPEVVCRPGDVCIIKRVSGWKTLPAPGELERAAISGGKAYLVGGGQLLEVERDQRFSVLSEAGPFRAARALAAFAGAIWVADAEEPRLHRFDLAERAWSSLASPVGPVVTLWGDDDARLFVGGEHGLARRDGASFRLVGGIPGPVHAVAGRSPTDVWVGAELGLYQVRARQ